MPRLTPNWTMLKWIPIAVGVLCLLAQSAAAFERANFYQVEKIDGVWWFVTPTDEPFASLGVNCVSPGSGSDEYDPEKPAYAAFRHYESTDAWADDAVRRLKAWNFNTIGGWGDPSVERGQLPYVKVLHLGGGVPWYDLFADDFAEKIDRLAEQLVTPHREDPMLLGWCSDNELGWYPDSIFLFHIDQPAASKTRQRLVKLLKEFYRDDFAALRRDFTSPDADSFEQLGAGGSLQLIAGGKARQAVLEFTRLLAERYYQVVHRAIRRVDSNHLILGDRYASFCPDVVTQAAGPYVDVITTNYDWPDCTDGYLPPHYLRRLHELTGRPVLVTEFYVAAAENRSGNPNSGNIFTTVRTQRERAAAWEKRVRLLAGEPYLVGVHWFQYADEPTWGRPKDGEDYNFGLVDIENRPYEELTASMTDLQGRFASIHAESGGSTWTAAEVETNQPIPGANGSPLAGIANWDKRGHLRPQAPAKCAADLVACWDAEHVYFAVMGLRFVDPRLYVDEKLTPFELLEFSITAADASEAVRLRFGAEKEVSVDGRAIDCRAWQEGVRYTAIAALPAAMFGKPRLAAGDEVELRAVIREERDDLDTHWTTTLQLD